MMAIENILNYSELEKEQAKIARYASLTGNIKRSEKQILESRAMMISSLQKAFRQLENKLEKDRLKAMKKAILNKKTIPVIKNEASPEEVAMCVLKIIFDTMNGRKSIYSD